jgi:hypothetical protein
VPTTSHEPQHNSNGYSIPYARQQEMARRSASTVQVGERNDWLFSCLAVNHGRPNVNRFKSNRDYTSFTNFLLPIAKRLNSELHDPLDEGEVERTSQSIIKFLLSDRFNRHRTSEEATFINRQFRWGVDYVSKIQQLADEQEIEYEAAKKRLQRNSSSPILHDRDGDIISHTSKSGRKRTYSPEQEQAVTRLKQEGMAVTRIAKENGLSIDVVNRILKNTQPPVQQPSAEPAPTPPQPRNPHQPPPHGSLGPVPASSNPATVSMRQRWLRCDKPSRGRPWRNVNLGKCERRSREPVVLSEKPRYNQKERI